MKDFNKLAASIVKAATGESQEANQKATLPERKKNAAAVALGRLGGKKGGRARADSLSPDKRAEIAKKAAAARWAKKPIKTD
jgi:hypothetical protein